MLAGQTNACLNLTNVSQADAGQYCVKVTGACNSVTNCATVGVITNVMATGPTNQLACPGANATFCIIPEAATPSGAFTWFRGTNIMPGGTNMIPGASSNCLTLTNLTAADEGTYCVVFFNGCVAVTNCATLTLREACIGITNLCPPEVTRQGQTLTVSGVVTNCGTSTLTNVMIMARGTLVKMIFRLLPGEAMGYSYSFVPEGCGSNIVTTATVTGTDVCTGQTITNSSTAQCFVVCDGECIDVTKLVACLLPNDNCGIFGKEAVGFKGIQDPGFCYNITITNCGMADLTSVIVMDDQLGNLTSDFFDGAAQGTLPVRASITRMFKVAWAIDTTNTVTVTGRSATTGTQVSDNDQAIARVRQASINCEAIAVSVDDLDGDLFDSHVQLPFDGNAHQVNFLVVVCNNGQANLTNVRIDIGDLALLGCTNPAPFNLPSGTCVTNLLCATDLTCELLPFANTVTVNAHVETSAGACGFDINGTNVTVRTICETLVECEEAGGCRVTGGGRQESDLTFPTVRHVTHGGQVGAPVGSATEFDPDSECIRGNWQHVRHIKGGSRGNFHAKSFDSLMCACLGCPENPGSGVVIGELCNPGDRICGPEPRRAPANKICFSGVGDYAESKGGRVPRSVLFRVDIEDRSEPGNSHAGGSTPPHDRHRIRIWILTDAELARLNNPNDRLLDMRRAIACTAGSTATRDGADVPNGTAAFGVRAPDIDDGGEMNHGNHQIHPMIKDCP